MSLGTEPSSGSATTGPTSFSEVSWSEASSASEPSTDTASTDSASADATVPPAESQSVEGTPQQSEPPKERWDAILANAREKALADYKQKYGWAEQVDQQTYANAVKFYEQFTTGDPVALLEQLAAQVQAHPEHGARLRSLAAKQLAAARQQVQHPVDDAMPQPDVAIHDRDGNITGQTYSEAGIAKLVAHVQRQTLDQVRQEFAPMKQTTEQIVAERARLASESFATSAMEGFNKLPEFATHAAEIGQRLKALNLQTDDPQVLTLAVKALYSDVTAAKRAEHDKKTSAKAQSQLLDNLQQKAAASTGINPGSAAPSTPKQYRSFNDLPAEMWK